MLIIKMEIVKLVFSMLQVLETSIYAVSLWILVPM